MISERPRLYTFRQSSWPNIFTLKVALFERTKILRENILERNLQLVVYFRNYVIIRVCEHF